MTRSEHERVTDELLRLTKQHNLFVERSAKENPPVVYHGQTPRFDYRPRGGWNGPKYADRITSSGETLGEISAQIAARYAALPSSRVGAPTRHRLKIRKPKLLVIGHGAHGKDTVAGILAREFSLSFASPSEFAAQRAIYPLVRDLYPSWQDAYADRRNHRELWFHAIRAYNLRPGPSLAEQLLQEHDMYLGMRSRDEFDLAAHLFDAVLWVDASERLEPEPEGSMELTQYDAEYTIDNNGTLNDLHHNVISVMRAVLDDFTDRLIAESQ